MSRVFMVSGVNVKRMPRVTNLVILLSAGVLRCFSVEMKGRDILLVGHPAMLFILRITP